MKALVTGGTGFIGSHLIEKLVGEGHEVTCLAKDEMNSSSLSALGVNTILCDVNNGADWEAILDDIEIIYHLAGITRARKINEYYEGNFQATQKLVEATKKHADRLSRFVYVSSLAAVGPVTNGSKVDEQSPYHPVSDYGKSKMLAEQEVLNAASALPVTIVRPSAVYGPRERDMYDYIKMIRSGVQLLIGFREKRLNLVHVNDLVNGICLAAKTRRAEGEVYFIGSEQAYTLEHLGLAIAEAVSKQPIHIHLPHALVYLIGIIGGLIGHCSKRQIFFNLEKAKESVQKCWDCSIEKAADHLGYVPKVTLETGMRQTYKWYLDHNWI